jgi:glutathione S-transferase
LVPAAGTPERLRYTYWLHFAEGSAMPPVLLKMVFDKIRTAPAPFFIKPVINALVNKVMASYILPTIETQLQFMEAELSQRPWFAGEAFSAADIQMSFPLEAAAARVGLDARYPRLRDWLARIHAMPAYVRALEKGGPYTLA